LDGDDLFERLRRELIGLKICFIRAAGNSLLFYVGCRPGDSQGLTLWFASDWCVSAPEGIIVDSNQALGKGDDGMTEVEFERFYEPICERLIDRPITDVQVALSSRDLAVTIADEYHIRTFASDPEEDYLWHIRENSTGLTLYASTRGWYIHIGKV